MFGLTNWQQEAIEKGTIDEMAGQLGSSSLVGSFVTTEGSHEPLPKPVSLILLLSFSLSLSNEALPKEVSLSLHVALFSWMKPLLK